MAMSELGGEGSAKSKDPRWGHWNPRTFLSSLSVFKGSPEGHLSSGDAQKLFNPRARSFESLLLSTVSRYGSFVRMMARETAAIFRARLNFARLCSIPRDR